MTENLRAEDDWVPDACTLPTVDQPLRRAEFDEFFAHDVLNVTQSSSLEARFELRPDPDIAARAARLAAHETVCCSFFTFELVITDGKIDLIVSTGEDHASVLATMTARAASQPGSAT